jgi:hypothetical protein
VLGAGRALSAGPAFISALDTEALHVAPQRRAADTEDARGAAEAPHHPSTRLDRANGRQAVERPRGAREAGRNAGDRPVWQPSWAASPRTRLGLPDKARPPATTAGNALTAALERRPPSRPLPPNTDRPFSLPPAFLQALVRARSVDLASVSPSKYKLGGRQMTAPVLSARGGRFQDDNFIVDDVNNGAWILFLKPEQLPWQRFFIDAGLGFWGEWSETDITDELDELDVVDLGARFEVIGASILGAHCTPAPRIELSLSAGSLVLEPQNPNELDGKSQVRFLAKSPS